MSLRLRFADSFSRYKLGNTSDTAVYGHLVSYWTTSQGGDVVAGGRNGQGFMPTAHVLQGTTKTLDHQSGWSANFAYKTPPTLASEFYQGRNNDSNIISARVNADGTVEVYCEESDEQVLLTAPLHASKFYHFEISYDLSIDDLGEGDRVIIDHCTLWVDGFAYSVGGPIDTGWDPATLISRDATVNRHVIRASVGGSIFDDLTLWDHPVADLGVTEKGDLKIIGILPNGDVVTDFTPSTGMDNYALLRVTPPPGDSSSVSSNTVGHQDIYDWEDIPSFSGTIEGVSITIYARKNDEGSRAFKIVVGDDGSEEQSQTFYLNDDYVSHHYETELDPATGMKFTVSGFNAKRWGFEIVAIA